MIDNTKMVSIRDEYIELIKKELLGPGSEISIPDEEHELISDSPNTRYSIGILYTKKTRINADNDDTARVEDIEDDVVIEGGEVIEGDENEGYIKHASTVSYSDENNLDEEVGLATQNMPSSMGITFFVKGKCDVINCLIKFATYRKAVAEDCRIPMDFDGFDTYELPREFETYFYIDRKEKTLRLTTGGVTRKRVNELKERDLLGGDEHSIIDLLYKLADQLSKGYVRIPHEIKVSLKFDGNDYIDNNKELDGTKAKITALRRAMSEGVTSVTIMLVNDAEEKSSAPFCLFQPSIAVASETNSFVFMDYNSTVNIENLDDEEKSLALLYRNKRVFGTGLGSSIGWEIDEQGKGVIYSDFFPEAEVPSMDFSLNGEQKIDKETFSMKYLSDLNDYTKEEKLDRLRTLIEAYSKWIGKTKKKREGLRNKELRLIADKNIALCEKCAARMEQGVETLRENEVAWNAFELANRAMFMQRAHIKLQEKMSDIDRYPYDEELSSLLDELDYYRIDEIISDTYSWRPFQLAFLLMSVNSIVYDDIGDRDIVDLIWFPTGGGKTEAYLGLTAFTIFFRRLKQSEDSGGTTVIMRYTLRLLAAQQFTRASTLICACEYIRNDSASKKPRYKKHKLGKERITIGLWIGGDHTPNKNKKAENELKELINATADYLEYAKDRHNKFQVLKCPWCGTKLVKDSRGKKIVGEFGYRMSNGHFEFYCPQESCFYNDILPIQVVDDELYKYPPTLLFGTVDKFAMIPWNPKTGSFFGIGSQNRAPELIIQDELHLISGPLGTMVGLYETIIDALCKSKGSSPKIIASTATIRRAAEQCVSLYNRDVYQFPSPGIDAEDSFFAKEAEIDYKKGVYGRKYVGLMPSGKTKAMMEIRSIAALLQKIHSMDLSYEEKDKFWTLTVYFNSLRDLGKCSTLVDDDVKDFIKRMSYRLGTSKDARIITNADELTSRVSTTQLNETLDKLEKLCYSKENLDNKRWPSNVLLATNMISVGIDVARLNVMLMVGQPKLTSEYIQASSRVGRSYPGVAFAMYDGSKSRDRSHYEQFRGYHDSFYRYVEPTGVTPFSKPARDRALHAVIITLLRQLNPELSSEASAAVFSKEKYENCIEEITRFIIDRNHNIVKKINPNMDDDKEAILQEIEIVLQRWISLVGSYDEDKFYYGEKYMFKHPEKDEGRLLKGYNTDKYDSAFDTMTSMRNVDISVGSSVILWEE